MRNKGMILDGSSRVGSAKVYMTSEEMRLDKKSTELAKKLKECSLLLKEAEECIEGHRNFDDGSPLFRKRDKNELQVRIIKKIEEIKSV